MKLNSILRINSSSIFYLLVFFHVYGSTWLEYSSIIRFFGYLLIFPLAISQFKISDNKLLLTSLLVIILLHNFIFSIDIINTSYVTLITILVLFNEYVFSKKLNVLNKLIIIRNCLRVFLIISMIFYLIGDSRVSDNIFGYDYLDYGNSFSGIFESVNYFFLFFLIYIAIFFLINRISSSSKKIDLLITALIFLVVFLKFQNINRTFILGLFIFFTTFFWKYKFSRIIFFSSIILSILFFSVLNLEILDQYGIKTKDFVQYGIFGNRTLLWQTIIDILNNGNYLFSGVGFSNEVENLNNLNIPGFENLHAHNTYLTLAHEFGIVFSLLLLIIVLYFSHKTIKRYNYLLPLFLVIVIFSFFDSLFIQGFNPAHIIFYSIFIFNNEE